MTAEIKIIGTSGETREEGTKKIKATIQKMLNEGWSLHTFTEAGRYGGYFSAVMTRDT